MKACGELKLAGCSFKFGTCPFARKGMRTNHRLSCLRAWPVKSSILSAGGLPYCGGLSGSGRMRKRRPREPAAGRGDQLPRGDQVHHGAGVSPCGNALLALLVRAGAYAAGNGRLWWVRAVVVVVVGVVKVRWCAVGLRCVGLMSVGVCGWRAACFVLCTRGASRHGQKGAGLGNTSER